METVEFKPKDSPEWFLSAAHFLLTIIGSVASVVVFSFVTFQTKADAEKDRAFYEQRLRLMEDLIVDLKADMKDANASIQSDLKVIEEHLLYLRRSKDLSR